MKNLRFNFLYACIGLAFILSAPSALYAEDQAPVEMEASVGQPDTTSPATNLEMDVPTSTAVQEENTNVDTNATSSAESATSTENASGEAPDADTQTNSSTSFILHLRFEDMMLYEGETGIASPSVEIIDNAGITHDVAGNSLLGALYTLDLNQENFAITDLIYYESFGAFFLNCITVAWNTEPACGNWIFAVNNSFPYESMDQYAVQPGDEIYVFFGSQFRAVVEADSITQGHEVTGQAQTYNYVTNVWEGADSVTLSVLQDNPENPWSPTVVTSSSVGDTGSAVFTLSATGTYKMGVNEDYFIHTDTFAILEAVATSTSDSTTEASTDSSGNSCTTCNSPELVSQSLIDDAIEKILSYIKTRQKNTGEIEDGATTDWLIMSFGAKSIYADSIAATSTSLLDYAKNYSFSSGAELNLCAGYPRHVLALLAAGVNTTDTTILELMQKIKGSECFDGTHYGEAGINDDIFALFALFATNDTPSDSEVSAIVASITADQQTSGAFTWNGWEGPDVTGAAINALKYAGQKGAEIDTDIFTKAKNYLKNQQLSDGGWGFGSSDVLTTSWAVMGINALGEGQSDWVQASGKNPWHIMTGGLSADGYYTSPYTGSNPDWFATKHAVPALNGNTWPIVLATVPNQEALNDICTGICTSTNGASGSTRGASSTEEVSTSTTHSPLQTPIIPLELIDGMGGSPIEEIHDNEGREIPENISLDEVGTNTQTVQIPSTFSKVKRKSIITPSAENTYDELEKIASIEIDTPPIEERKAPSAKQTYEETPVTKIAENVFSGAAVGTTSIGVFLAWRFVLALL